MVPFEGARMLENTMNSRGFGAFWHLRWMHFGVHFGSTDFWTFHGINLSCKGEMSSGQSRIGQFRFTRKWMEQKVLLKRECAKEVGSFLQKKLAKKYF